MNVGQRFHGDALLPEILHLLEFDLSLVQINQ